MTPEELRAAIDRAFADGAAPLFAKLDKLIEAVEARSARRRALAAQIHRLVEATEAQLATCERLTPEQPNEPGRPQ